MVDKIYYREHWIWVVLLGFVNLISIIYSEINKIYDSVISFLIVNYLCILLYWYSRPKKEAGK